MKGTVALNGAVGFNLGKSWDFTTSASSAPLNLRQKVEGFYQYNYEKLKVVQQQYLTAPGGGKTSVKVGSPVTCYVYKPILPLISFKYY